jgi:hypothetical protein
MLGSSVHLRSECHVNALSTADGSQRASEARVDREAVATRKNIWRDMGGGVKSR